jgi:hypothetical protein
LRRSALLAGGDISISRLLKKSFCEALGV